MPERSRAGWPTGMPVRASKTSAVSGPDSASTRVPSGLKVASLTPGFVSEPRLQSGAGAHVPKPGNPVFRLREHRCPSRLNEAAFTAAGWRKLGDRHRLLATAAR